MSEEKKEENKVSIKNLPNSEVEIEGEISAEQFESYYKRVIAKLGKEVEISGFRKGHVPEKVLVEKVGANAILHEMAQSALSVFYPRAIIENNIEAIGKPEITITKLARGNPLEFKAKTAVLPAFELPDYKNIAAKAISITDEEILVTEEDVASVIEQIRKNWQQSQSARGKNAEQSQNDARLRQGFGGQAETETNESKNNKELPELTDEFVKKLGKFETVADFKEKIKENLAREKEIKAKEKKRIAVIDAILRETDMALPAVLVESEMDRMLARFKGNISAMGNASTSFDKTQDRSLRAGTFEEYLTQIKKTESELREGWRKDAERGVKIQLLLQKIAAEEKLKVSEGEIKKEIEHLTKHHPKADKDRARRYIEGVLLHEKVFQFLENSDPNVPNASE